ncbi:MAG: S8 family serine peptidase [Candidatus Hodarchaeales archaeon]|jgi:subtilisin family serine protease
MSKLRKRREGINGILLLILLVTNIFFLSAMDTVRQTVDVEEVWELQSPNNQPLLGSNIRIAIIDSGIDWQHPFFYMPSGVFTINISQNTPYVDLNSNGLKDGPNENLNYTREELLDVDGTPLASRDFFDEGIDYLFNDLNSDGIRDNGEKFYLFNDTDQSNNITTNDMAYPLDRPKIEHIWDVWNDRHLVRGVNLTDPVINTENDTDGHGTHIAGIIAGGYPKLTRFTGIAPNATLLIAKVRDDTTGTYPGNYVNAAIDWAVAEQVDIISLSLGLFDDQYRDGSDPIDAKIDWAKQNGILVVVAGGNYADKNTHAQDVLTSRTKSTIDWTLLPFFEQTLRELHFTILWRYPHHNTTFSLIMPDGTPIPNIPIDGSLVNVTDINDADQYLVTGVQSNSTRGTMKQFITIQKLSGKFLMANPPSSGDTEFANPVYPMLANLTIRDEGRINPSRNMTPQEYHVYLSDTLAGPNGIYTRFMNKISPNYTITVPATSDSAISVGAHIPAWNSTDFTSRGPRIDRAHRPLLTAPGVEVHSASSQDAPNAPAYFYTEKSGTSMATPIVAGTLALALQMNPSLTHEQIKQLLYNTTEQDAFVTSWGSVPNNVFGYGKLNASEFVLQAAAPRLVTYLIPSTFINGSTVPLMVNMSDYSKVSRVLFNYSVDQGATWLTLNASLSGSPSNGIWTVNIPPLSATQIYVKIIANDSYGLMYVSGIPYIINSVSATTTTTPPGTTTTTTSIGTTTTTTPPGTTTTTTSIGTTTTTTPGTTTTTTTMTTTIITTTTTTTITTTTTTTTTTASITPGYTLFVIGQGILLLMWKKKKQS